MSVIKTINSNDSSWQYSVLSILNTPPGSPSEGNRYLVGTSPTSSWVGYGNYIMLYTNSAWLAIQPKEGMYVYNIATKALNKYDGTNWLCSNTYIGANPPSVYTNGSMWYSTTDGLLFTYDTSNSRNKWLSVSRRIIDFIRGGAIASGTAQYLRCDSNVSGNSAGYYLPRNGLITSWYGMISSGDSNRTYTMTYYSDASTSASINTTMSGGTSVYQNNLNLPIAKEKAVNMSVSATGNAVNDSFFEFEVAWVPSNV